jgi:CopG family nickel-responsive transcriptional regulator
MNRAPVTRVSVSLPEPLVGQLDAMVAERGFESRSQAVAAMINRELVEHRSERGDEVMAGTITLLYDHSMPGLQKHLADLQHAHVDAVISSLHVHLMDAHTMEVILVQGPARRLQGIADQMAAARGVVSGRLQLTSATLPPLHSRSDGWNRAAS